jgi:TolB-like protein/Tfp pilus assembly protein PilF
MSETGKAVFLSYASQDAEAARRICEALRAAGVEVWFDQSELVGGDAWDQKIRRHIKECELLIPVISQNTQARTEGYFRLEWRLADQRTHLMAKGRPFLLPVVIDDTRDAEAHVPDSFTEVQWTRLKGGETPPAFVARVKKLLSGEIDAGRDRRIPPAPEKAGFGDPALQRKSKPIWLWVLLALVVALPAYCIFKPRRSPEEVARLIAQAQALGINAANAAKPVETPAAPSEAGQLVKQARDLIYDPDSARNEFGLAENLLKRATELAPTSGEAWGASALLNHYFYSRAYDQDRQRLARSLAEAEKALRLSPHNTDALLALGLHRQILGEAERAKDYLEQAHASDPQNFKVILAQSLQIADMGERADFLRAAAAHVAQPAEIFYYASVDYDCAGRWEDGRAMSERAIAAQPFWRVFVERAVNEYVSTADPAKIDAWLDRVPELKRDEPRVAFMRYQAALLHRDGAAAVRVLNALAADYLEDNFYTGPKSYLLAQAYELAGQPTLALEQWQLTERSVRDRLASNPNEIFLRPTLAVVLAAQQRAAEARQAAAACEADERIRGNWLARGILAEAWVRLGDPDHAIVLLSGDRGSTRVLGDVTAATLAADPRWDALRHRPGYAPLLEQLRGAENGGARPAPAAAAPVTVPAVDEKSVAVLAFANLSDDKGNEYFSDGISEELLNVLAKVPGLKVTARTSSFYFKGKEVPIPEIARQLHVAYVVEGSVRKAGDKVRITAQLIKASDGFRVWSETYDRELKDIFTLQDEIAALVNRHLRSTLLNGPAVAAPAGLPGRTQNLAAYELFLRGRFEFNKKSPEGLRRSIALFGEAVRLDPQFALAWAETAAAHGWLISFFAESREIGLPPMRAAAERALALSPDLPETQRALTELAMVNWDWQVARQMIDRALALAAGDSDVLQSASYVALARGETTSAVGYTRQALAIDPLNVGALLNLGLAAVPLGDYAVAEAAGQQLVQLSPEADFGYFILADIRLLQNRPEEALAISRQSPAQQRLAVIEAMVYHAQGDRAKSDAALGRVMAQEPNAFPYYIACIYAFRGEKDQAFAWLDTARGRHSPFFTLLKTEPLLKTLHDDPRWTELLRKVNLADEQLK